MRSLAEDFSIGNLAGMMDEESIAMEFSIGSLARMMDEESSRGILYRESGRDDL